MDHATASTPEELAKLFMATMNSGDLEGLVSLYAPDAIFKPDPGTTVRGTDEIRNALRVYIDRGAQITLTPRNIHKTDDLAVIANDATVTGFTDDGTDLTTTTTEVVRRSPEGHWHYVVDDPFFSATP
ncbi:nuclear transport factor 2 family protein [Spongiactinospora sp. TRM90649]|uniref:YybH family protein n=1 Tax=Spongiactinospora sp. TRM90649 TaxID=3031114 RepID=UPI0023F74017|nr:nuclear transport factor 2 family protein [Spongiactinospora sp. TRM90649]MDF5755553.1 nuclear transport factor 2 family protein [Spongiactinospora sp. TRM90649]